MGRLAMRLLWPSLSEVRRPLEAVRKLAGAQTRCLPFQDSARQRSGMRIRGEASHGLLSQTKLRNDPYSGLP